MVMLVILCVGAGWLVKLGVHEGRESERLLHQKYNAEISGMLLAYDANEEQRKLACIKAEQMKVVFGGEWLVVRRRVGVRDASPQGYVVLAQEQLGALGLPHKEYVTVYDTAATEENRQDE
jgi:hypothetical protein